MRGFYGVEIKRISAGAVEQQVLKLKRFPSSVVRFCTDRLKIQPSRKFYSELADSQGGFEVWCGMRSGESGDRAKRYANKISGEIYPPHEVNASYPQYLAAKGVTFRLPILEWSSDDVLKYLAGNENPLYAAGFDRVGCFPCLASTARKHQQAFDFDAFGASQKQRVIELEKAIGKKHEPANTSQMCMFCHL
jgi:3'-phosphoadenosine 5'-phosphosulfate sulfotransferase (PAPS reductase)/FAD synthetase